MPAFPALKGRYEIRETLGQGGMGVIYRAWDSVLRCEVAVKTIRDAPDRTSLDLFYKECEVLATVNHPNIVKIIDIGEYEEDGQQKPYFVMPLISGITLDRLIKDSSVRLTADRCVEILIQTCRGLHAAHEHGVVHRDLKPSNIFVRKDDTVEIIDFGIVHMSALTSTVGIKGTLFYMAPETLQMKKPTPLSDIFALGVVAYEMFTRRRPFDRPTESETVKAILEEIPPPVSDVNPAIPQAISRVIHKALAKQPWHRFGTAKDFADTLVKAHRGEAIDIFDPARIQPRVQRARKAFDAGDHQFAHEILSELLAEGHMDSEIALLQKQIELATRRRRICQLLESARTRIEGEEYPLALQKIQEVLDLDPDNTDALGLRQQVESARSDRQIDEWIRLSRQHIENCAFSHARDALRNLLQIRPSDTRGLQLMAEVDRLESDYHRSLQDKRRLYDSAVEAYHEGELSQALSKLEKVLELDRRAPDSTAAHRATTYQNLYNQVRSEYDAIQQSYAEARRLLGEQNYTKAVALCQECLTKYPGNALFAALKFDIEEQQRQKLSSFIAEVDRAVDGEPDLQKRVNILRDAVERFPDEAHFQRSLRLMRDRLDLVNGIVAKARHLEERGQFAEALGQWEILRNIHAQYPGLAVEVERVRRRREQQARAEQKARWVEDFDRRQESGDYAGALEVARRALEEFPEDGELMQLRNLAVQALERTAQARQYLADANRLFEAGQFDAGIDRLTEARALDDRSIEVRALLSTRLVERARALLDGDARAAEQYLNRALELDPNDQSARSVRILIEDARREEFLSAVVGRARSLQAEGDLRSALSEVAQGLQSYPMEPRLVQLHSTLTKGFLDDEKKQQRARELERLHALANAAVATADVDALRQILETAHAITLEYCGDPEFTRYVSGIEKLLNEHLARQPSATQEPVAETPAEPALPDGAGMATVLMGGNGPAPADLPAAMAQTPLSSGGSAAAPAPAKSPAAPAAPAGPAARPPAETKDAARRRKPGILLKPGSRGLLYATGAAVAVLAVVIGIVQWQRSRTPAAPPAPGTVAVQFLATPEDAVIKVGDKTITPGTVELAPGEYLVQATKDGFTTFTHKLSIAGGQTTPPVEIQLTPLPPSIQLFVEVQGAKVSLNGGAPEELPGGMIIKDDLAAGKHRFLVETGRNKTIFEIEIAPQTAPSLSTLSSPKDVQTMIIGTYKDQVRIRTTLDTGKVFIAGREAGTLRNSYFEQPITPGKYDVVVGEGDAALSRSVEVANRPIVAVYVGTNTNLGYLFASVTGAEEARIKIDGKDRGATRKGQFRISLEPKDYTMETSQDGYLTDTRTVTIRKGAQHRVEIPLVPVSRQPAPSEPKPQPPVEFAKPVPKPNGTLRVEVTPADATVTYSRGTENPQPFRKPEMSLQEGTYLIAASAPGYTTKSDPVQVHSGQTAKVSLALIRITQERAMTADDWDGTWRREDGWFVFEQPRMILFRQPIVGSARFNIRTREAGRLTNPRIRIVTNLTDPQNYTLIELDKDEYTRVDVRGGRRLKQKQAQLKVPNRIYSVILTLEPARTSIRINDWFADEFNATGGRFGFLATDKDKIYVSDFRLVTR
ncbi:MAG TPA: protein kinase [Bryobacteraceae bacterium]|nr:protein kinase [Bryobacteraceae bacterium]